MSRRRPRRQKMGPGRTSGDPVDPVTIPDVGRLCFSIRWLGLLSSPCKPGDFGIGCPLRQELGTD